MAARTIIKTATAGWYEDPATGKKTRKQDGDRIVTRGEYDQMLLDKEPSRGAPRAKNNGGESKTPGRSSRGRKQSSGGAASAMLDAMEAKKTKLTTGKHGTGKTVTIKCAWVDPDKRTAAQTKLFEGDPRKITYDAVKKAAGGKRSAMPDGRERVIQPQDAFQTRFHPDNQQKWRAELRRRKNKTRRERARAAARR